MYGQITARTQQAVQHFQAGRLIEASELLGEVLAVQPRDFDALHILGVIRAMQGEPEQAITLFRKALDINKNNNFLQFNIAKALSEMHRDAEALVHHRRATQLAPGHSEAWLNYGLSLLRLEMNSDAQIAFERAVDANPKSAAAWSNLGFVLGNAKQPDKALQALDSAIALDPALAEARFNRGSLLEDIGDLDAAEFCYRKALDLRTDYPEARYNLALLQLHRQNFEEGWKNFENRWQVAGWSPPDILAQGPRWTGASSDRPLLLWGEQGIGDQILFGTVLPELATLPRQIFAAIDRRLIPLFKRSIPNINFIDLASAGDAAANAEQLPFGSIPELLRPTAESFSSSKHPLLVADQHRVSALGRLIREKDKLICGVSWHSVRRSSGTQKSLALGQLVSRLPTDRLRFVSLQYGDTATERDATLKAHGIAVQQIEEIDYFNDIDGLAALTEACDLVITTSNTTAHIAGALGKETLLLLPKGRGRLWYWSDHNGKNLWYPSIKSFSQSEVGQWNQPLEQLRRFIEDRT